MSESDYWKRFHQRRLGRRAVLRAAVVGSAGVAAAAFVGCGGDDDSGPSGPTQSPGAATGPASPTPAAKPRSPKDVKYARDMGDTTRTPKVGGTMKIGQSITFPSIDPVKNAALDPVAFHARQSSTLLAHDASPGVTFFEEPVVGDLAEKWEIADPTTINFTLNARAKWNNRPPAAGRAVTADDVKWTYERYMAGGLTKPRFATVDSVTVVNPTTVRVKLKGPTPEIVDVFAFEFHPILNPQYIASLGDDMGNGSVNYVGSGPFLLTEWNPRVSATWERNPDYFGVDKAGRKLPYLDKIQWTWLTDPASRKASFDAGNIDAVQLDDIAQFSTYAPRDDVYITRGSIASGQLILAVSHKKPPFQDPRVRQAISYAIDRVALNEQVYGGGSDPALPLPPRALGEKSFPGYDKLPETYRHNPTKAKELLTQAGYANGLDIGPLFYWFLNQTWENQTLLVQDMLKKVGITAKPTKIDRSPFLNMYLTSQPWDGMLMQHSTTPGVSSQAWAEWIHSKATNNYWGINDPEIDSIVEKLRTELDEPKRQTLFKQLQDRETSQAHRVWINQLANLTVHRSYQVNPQGNAFLNYKHHADKFTWYDR